MDTVKKLIKIAPMSFKWAVKDAAKMVKKFRRWGNLEDNEASWLYTFFSWCNLTAKEDGGFQDVDGDDLDEDLVGVVEWLLTRQAAIDELVATKVYNDKEPEILKLELETLGLDTAKNSAVCRAVMACVDTGATPLILIDELMALDSWAITFYHGRIRFSTKAGHKLSRLLSEALEKCLLCRLLSQ